MPRQLKHAMCNEAFESTPFVEQCRTLKNAGYEGIEIAPFTLAPDPLDITPEQRREYARTIPGEGLQFVGLHWLMVSPKGLHVTTPEKGLRDRSWGHIRNLIDLCADLGDNGVMVFGSPAAALHHRRPDARAGHAQLHRGLGSRRSARRGARRNGVGGSPPGRAVRRGTESPGSGRYRAGN
jgi:sugar phosphate isomerase/epimerase